MSGIGLSAVQVHMKQGLPLAPGMEIGYVVKDAKMWDVDPERTTSEFDAGYYGGLLGKAWMEAAFVFSMISQRISFIILSYMDAIIQFSIILRLYVSRQVEKRRVYKRDYNLEH